MTDRPVTITLPRLDDDDAPAGSDAVTRFDVERYACGELTGDARARVEAALAADPALRAFHDDVVASDRGFLVQAPPAAFLAKLEARQAAATPAGPLASLWAALRRLVSGPVLAAATAGTAILFVVVANDRDASGDDVGVRTKGGDVEAALGFFVRDGAGAHLGQPGEPLRAGDQIQLAVTDPSSSSSAAGAGGRALVVVGIDATGAVSTYAAEPVDGTRSKGAGPRVLPASLVLDDTVGAERFFAVWGEDVEATRAAAVDAAASVAARVRAGTSPATLARLPLDERFAQSSVHIVKVR